MSTTPAGPPSGPQDVEADLARRRAATTCPSASRMRSSGQTRSVRSGKCSATTRLVT